MRPQQRPVWHWIVAGVGGACCGLPLLAFLIMSLITANAIKNAPHSVGGSSPSSLVSGQVGPKTLALAAEMRSNIYLDMGHFLIKYNTLQWSNGTSRYVGKVEDGTLVCYESLEFRTDDGFVQVWYLAGTQILHEITTRPIKKP